MLLHAQVLLYDPLFDWTMNPLKAFHLQHDEQQELNATLSSTMGGGAADDIVGNRKAGYVDAAFTFVTEKNLLCAMETVI